MNALLDAVLVDVDGTLADEASAGVANDSSTVAFGHAEPHPAGLQEAMQRLGLDDPRRVLFVGEQGSHARAADAAGVFTIDASAGDGTLVGAVAAWVERHAGECVEQARASVVATDPATGVEAGHLHDQLTKPPGSLGRLESLGVQLAAIAGTCPPPLPEPAAVVVFAADHGVVASGTSAWPQEVTAQMVSNFARGGAAVNVLARQVGATVTVVDVGVAAPIPWSNERVLGRVVRRGTSNLAIEPAMSRTEALAALDVGVELADRAVADGARCLVTGDMGIGNTTASAAIIAAATGQPAADVVGRGAGADDETMARKLEVIGVALERLNGSYGANGPLALLEDLGGFEIAALAGFIIGGAVHRVPIVVDGVIACAALLIACGLAPDARGYVIAGHRSVEPGATAALEFLGLEPLLDLDLRLGEGTGAVLALPLVQSAARILNEMATFDAAGVTDKR